MNREAEMFSLNLVEGYRPRGLKRMEVCNGIVIMALENCHIIRLSLESPEDIEGTRIFFFFAIKRKILSA